MNVAALCSLSALEVACDEGVLPHLARLRQAITETSGDERFVLERVAEVLRLHLALLLRRPDALWPALYAHGAFVDSPRARSFNVSAPGPDMPMLAQVHRWLREREALHPRAPWLKALTPTTPWGGGLLAELRGLERPTVLTVADGVVSVATAAGPVHWRPDTGEVNPAPAPRSHAASFAHPRGGGLTLTRAGQTRSLLGPMWLPTKSALNADGSHLTSVATEDGETTFAFVFDTHTGEQRAAVEVAGPSAVGLSADGRWLAWRGFGGQTVVQHLETRERWQVFSDEPGSLAVDRLGTTVASVERGVVRLYSSAGVHRSAPFSTYSKPPQFSSDGATVLLSTFLLDGADGSVRCRHDHLVREYLVGGPAPLGTRVTRERLCVADGTTTAVVEVSDGREWSMANASSGHQDAVAWSGDGRMFATCRAASPRVRLFTVRTERTVEASGPLCAIALDQTGSQLALLHTDGTVELQAGGTRLRALPGATGLAFIADDTALVVGGPRATVVIGLDGRERWRSTEAFTPDNAGLSAVEWKSGARSPSPAEAVELHVEGGLTLGEGLIFPHGGSRWVRSPSSSLLACDTVVLSLEGP